MGRRYRIASSMGPGYMIPQPVKDLAHANRWMTENARLLGGMPGSATLRVEYLDPGESEWHPLER